jgi:hypothetical protein
MYLNLRTKELFILMLNLKIKPPTIFFFFLDYKKRCPNYLNAVRFFIKRVLSNCLRIQQFFSGSFLSNTDESTAYDGALANCVAWLNVSLLLIPNQSLGII